MHRNNTAASGGGARTHVQLDLFGGALSSALPIVGAPRPCQCGCRTAVLGSSRGPHAGALICTACGKHSWASHSFVTEMRGFVTGTSSYAPGSRP
jgi:hypothetical protein